VQYCRPSPVQPYVYTVPRRPIAAMFASPGPALYDIPTLLGRTLHDPRSVHVRGPAYSLASRAYMHKQDQSPGPKYLPPAKVQKSTNNILIMSRQQSDAANNSCTTFERPWTIQTDKAALACYS